MPPLRLALCFGTLVGCAALPLSATLDRDQDGISDLWAEQYPGIGAATADPDGDGASNLAEALAGTDPTSPASRFTAVPERDANGDLLLRWPSIAGKRYHLRFSADLVTWVDLPTAFPGTGADRSEIISPIGAPAAPRQFWQVAVTDFDTDADALNDWEEAQLGTSPSSPDTDSDGMPDG